ncbi:hypothetical protein GCM10022271_18620 [Corallibacter vietnamensis]|uniref:Anti-sigma K factor RskA C-terminal domain-containing protein n=1 Tax=Corallibacter vietnamensis TaxID=904130 RepID=A0ABP7H6A0_9FLAO
MDTKEYIESGILELYVAGTLSEKEYEDVYNVLLKHPDVLDEVLKIEAAVISLTAAVSPHNTQHIFKAVKEQLGLDNNRQVITMNKPKSNWFKYSGWAAAIILAGGLLWTTNQNNTLKSDIQTVETDKELLEIQLEKVDTELSDAKQLITVLRDKDIIAIPLAGQTAYPEAYAKAYWDKKGDVVYFDLQGLPTPPNGKVYQIWSLKLSPLTPTSLGTVDNFTTNESKIFTINNANESEAFGITLEPAGGSQSPTLEQLYTLGAVSTSS